MSISRPIAERVSLPSPDEIRAAREKAGLTQEAAGALVSSSKQPRRTWDKWETTNEANAREMPLPTWELFLLLTNQHPILGLIEKN
ncbi:hypothetical protein ACT2FY_39055 [Paraburkholderia fungorum]|uniref:hypothetical protein n=1 Tax=Paraburkholderia fungorum TaxID=134537 RepID=UPI00402BE9EF